MLPKEELKKRRTDFWTLLDSEMTPVRGVHGNKVSWLSYKSCVKELYIRMEFDGKGCRLCLDLQHKDTSIRALFFEQFLELKTVMQSSFSTPLNFLDEYKIEASGIFSARVMSEDTQINFFRDEDIPKAIEFLKTQLISLDEFWTEFKDIFIGLQK